MCCFLIVVVGLFGAGTGAGAPDSILAKTTVFYGGWGREVGSRSHASNGFLLRLFSVRARPGVLCVGRQVCCCFFVSLAPQGWAVVGATVGFVLVVSRQLFYHCRGGDWLSFVATGHAAWLVFGAVHDDLIWRSSRDCSLGGTLRRAGRGRCRYVAFFSVLVPVVFFLLLLLLVSLRKRCFFLFCGVRTVVLVSVRVDGCV